MLFNSIEFLIFYPIVLGLYFVLPYKWRWPLLLVASYYFYMSWRWSYIFLIVGSTLVDYCVGLALGRASDKSRRKRLLGISVLLNLGLLVVFKYLNFFAGVLADGLGLLNLDVQFPVLDVALPVGISFYTFQTLSYSIDVYRGVREPERHLGIFALYVSFFPQLVAGPIERSTHLLPQLHHFFNFSWANFFAGLKLMAWGFFKKLVIADRLVVAVNAVYGDPQQYGGGALIVATYCFAYQLYCDFSGYTDIARGAAKMMGYDLMENFNRPFFAKSISEFWSRWHMSLTGWFKTYLFRAMGGGRVAKWRAWLNIFTVFLVTGFWHGAGWTFLIWGAMNGVYVLVSHWSKSFRKRLHKASGLTKVPQVHHILKIVTCFHLTMLGFIFGRSLSVGDAWYYVTHLFSDWDRSWFAIGIPPLELGIAVVAVIFLELVDWLHVKKPSAGLLDHHPLVLRWSVYLLMVWALFSFAEFNQQAFFYFQF